MLRAIWICDPVSSGDYKSFNEPFAYDNNKWFFDKSVWQKMFRMMDGCGFNGLVMANTHPFPFMVDTSPFTDAKIIDDSTLGDYQNMHHWIFETALDYGIAPYVLFHNIYLPDAMLKARGIDPSSTSVPTDLASEYMHHVIRRLLETYPELAGIVADVTTNISEKRAEFTQQVIIDALDAARPDIALWLRVASIDADGLADKLKRRGNRPINYLAKYSADHLVNSNPDPAFSKWIGAANVLAELSFTNFAPFSCFSYDTAEGILENLQDSECDGFVLHPISDYEWPRTSDTFFKFQWQRDMVWYNLFGGITIPQLVRDGQPKWLGRNQKMIPGLQAGSGILELLSLYIATDKSSLWHPQICSVQDKDGAAPHLLSIEDTIHLSSNWWTEITGDKVTHISEYLKTGTPEDSYGPDEFIEELNDLATQAVAAGEKGMRNASGEKELPSFSCDVMCMGRLGEFYAERFKAALAHARGEDTEARDHMSEALELFREIQSIDASHRDPFIISAGTGVISLDWMDVIDALEKEYEDACHGVFKQGSEYLINTIK